MGYPLQAYSKLPLIGPWLGRIGKSAQILSTPCMNSPLIIAQAAAMAAPRLLYSLFGPDCTDDLYDYLRGKGGLHGRKSIFGTLGSLPPTAAAEGLPVWMYELGDLGQKVGWYFALVDSTLEGILNWTSLVYQYSGCHIPGTPYAQSSMDSGNIGTNIPEGSYVVNTWRKGPAHIFTNDSQNIVCPAGYSPGVGFSLKSEPNSIIPRFDATWNAALYSSESASPIAIGTPITDGNGHTYVNLYDFEGYQTPGGKTYSVVVTKTRGILQWSGGNFFAYGTFKNALKLGVNPSRCDPFTASTKS